MKVYSELKEASLENLASDPASPATGRFWYDTTTKQLKLYNGTNSIGVNSYPTAKSSNYTITDADGIDFILASGSGTAITLPTPAANIGRIIRIKRNDSSNLISITRDSASDTIDGVADDYYLGDDLQCLTLIAYAANTWYII